MKIAIHTRLLPTETGRGEQFFFKEIVGHWILNNSDDQFILLGTKKRADLWSDWPNVSWIDTGKGGDRKWMRKWWYNYQLPSIAKKHGAELLLSFDGCCSLKTKMPQCVVLYDRSFLQQPGIIDKHDLVFYQKNLSSFLSKADKIITVSDFLKKQLIDENKWDENKIAVIKEAGNQSVRPLNAIEKQKIKDELTAGTEYFLYTGIIHPAKNILSLIKSFSLFKKRQQTGMKLVLMGPVANASKKLIDSLGSYKFKNDLVLIDEYDTNEEIQVIAAAYAVIDPCTDEGFDTSVVNALRAGVPVIAANNSAGEEMAKDAGLYFDPADEKDLSEKMMRIYKDESLHAKLAACANNNISFLAWGQSAKMFWETICSIKK